MSDHSWNTMEFFETATVAAVTTCLNSGADVNAQDQSGYTPLHYAVAFNSDPAVAKTLLKAGADLQARDHEWGATPLHWCAWANKNPSVIIALLESGAEPNVQDKGGGTPLHAAVLNNSNPAIVIALLDAGAKTGIRDQEEDKTPLDYASENTALKDSNAYRRLVEQSAAPGQ